jgi:hypothetical protein
MIKLSIQSIICIDGRRVALWDEASRKHIAGARAALVKHLQPVLSSLCCNVKNHGGIKGALKSLQSCLAEFPFAARFDVASYYDSIRHDILLHQLAQTGLPEDGLDTVRQYLEAPDKGQTGVSLTAGGSLSSLLGALYLCKLDKAFEVLSAGKLIFYRCYMDDIVILAKTRRKMRQAILLVYRILGEVGMRAHKKQKRFIGRTVKGFDFLGYRLHPGRRLRPSKDSLHRLREHARRLYEQGASITRLRQYVLRWWRWFWGVLEGLVCVKGGMKRYWVHVRIQLDINGKIAVKRPL